MLVNVWHMAHINKDKIIKDPIYGYISVPIDLVNSIIDTAEFQRLRRIIQTSYSSVYPSSSHNRFTHSLGVYHLGSIAIQAISSNSSLFSKDVSQKQFEHLSSIFVSACLLHDVGHAPFSHTTEKFFNNDEFSLHDTLVELIESDEFTNDFSKDKKSAEHEKMSCILSLKEIDFIKGTFDKEDKEFFVRCIIGLKYTTKSLLNSFKNCLISLLNSSIIDVDKLDYLIRDSNLAGYDSIKIDYKRLLKSVRIVKDEFNDRYVLTYSKNGISVIENVVLAHDYEKKWIQTQPTILYECNLINTFINLLADKQGIEFVNKLFSLESLSIKGQDIEGVNIKLLSDDDIIFFIKSRLKYEEWKELFCRSLRKKPLWKSESEFNYFFKNKLANDFKKKLLDSIKQIVDWYTQNFNKTLIVNEDFLKLLDEQVDDSKATKTTKNYMDGMSEKIKYFKILCDSLKKFFKECDIAFEFALIDGNRFVSSTKKSDFGRLKIMMDKHTHKFVELNEITTLYNQKNDNDEEYIFYIFCSKPKKYINVEKIAAYCNANSKF